jgi:hypothetical protein
MVSIIFGSKLHGLPGKCFHLHAGGAIHARPHVFAGEHWGILDEWCGMMREISDGNWSKFLPFSAKDINTSTSTMEGPGLDLAGACFRGQLFQDRTIFIFSLNVCVYLWYFPDDFKMILDAVWWFFWWFLMILDVYIYICNMYILLNCYIEIVSCVDVV